MEGSRLWSPMVAPLLTSSVTPAVTYQQALKTVSKQHPALRESSIRVATVASRNRVLEEGKDKGFLWI